MHTLSFLILAGLLSSSLSAPQKRWEDGCNRAIYTLSNNPDGNNVLALALDARDGTVSSPTLTPTGGKGLLGLNVGPPFGAPGSPAGPDGLFGQGAVHASHGYLFVVNPGSNTLSMFQIADEDPLHPKLVGKPASTLGEFPTSVAFSYQLKTACVLNGGAKNGVACFSVSDKGLHPADSLRPLPKLNTKTPPIGPPDTSTEVRFNPDASAVFVTQKGHPGPPAVPGFIYAFPVENGKVSSTPVVSSPKGLILDFSINFLSHNTALITDPTFGASIVSIGSDLSVTETHHTVIPNQGAACWGVYSPHYDAAYVIDAGQPNITILNPQSGQIKGAIQFEADSMGGFDTVIERQWIYTLTGSSAIVVINLEADGGREEQLFPLAQYGTAGHWQGMGVHSKCAA